MGNNSDDGPLKRRAIKMALWFCLLVLHTPRVARGFVVVVDNGSAMPQRITTRTAMAAQTIIVDAPTDKMNLIEKEKQEESNSCHGVDDNSNGDDDSFSVLCPSSYPSKTFAAPNLDVSYQPIESDDANGDSGVLQLLPLQKYHARTKKRRRRRRDSTDQESMNKDFSNGDCVDNNESSDLLLGTRPSVKHDIPSLDFIYENLCRFAITKSSEVLLEEYHSHKQNCDSTLSLKDDDSDQNEQLRVLKLLEGRLRSKLRAECRASLPLSIDETLQILYCDSHICVVNKPSGVLSVPGHRRNPSLANLVYDTIQPSSCSTCDDGSIDTIDQSVVHRLDMATSGIICYAISKRALSELQMNFRDRKVQKTYQALVEGHLLCGNGGDGGGATEGEIDVALERDPNNPPYMRIAQPREEPKEENSDDSDVDSKTDTNDNANPKQQSKQHKFWREAPKPSMTTWSILSYEHDRDGNPLTRVALKPHTGRTHQLRVHTSQVLGAPIVADDIYGSGTYHPLNANLCLHAQQLCIHHPITGAPMVFEADPPF